MIIRGIIERSFRNFACFRGFAKLGLLQQISRADDNFQRKPNEEHVRDIVEFYDKGEYLFFPEIVLGAVLADNIPDIDIASELYQNILQGKKSNLRFSTFTIQTYINQFRSSDEQRVYDYFQRGTIELSESMFEKNEQAKFTRIDGNHRLLAESKNQQKFKDIITPFCLVLFRDNSEAQRYSRVLFHNINFKQAPLSMEQNLKLILEDEELFPDEQLKSDPSFGWPYYLARKLTGKIDYDAFPHIKKPLKDYERTFLVKTLSWLIEEGIIGENENAIQRFKQAISEIHSIYNQTKELQLYSNSGLLGAFLYHQIKPEKHVSSFLNWVLSNYIYSIESSHSKDLVQVFNSILESRGRTIFVSMKFNTSKTEDHYQSIEKVANCLNDDYKLSPKLRVQRVDLPAEGHSYQINDKILKMISDCGLLIGNLTYCNPNVYYEIGIVMGKSKALNQDSTNFLLFLDESVDDIYKHVAFTLASEMQIRFTQINDFENQLKDNLERFFHLK